MFFTPLMAPHQYQILILQQKDYQIFIQQLHRWPKTQVLIYVYSTLKTVEIETLSRSFHNITFVSKTKLEDNPSTYLKPPSMQKLKLNLYSKILNSTYQTDSLTHLEKIVLQELKPFIGLQYIKINFQNLKKLINYIEIHLKLTCHISPIQVRTESKKIFNGQIVFARKEKMSPSNLKLLTEISTFISTVIEKIVKFGDWKSLKQQWECTFDAILDPMCLINEHLQLIHCNKSFLKAVNLSLKAVKGQQALNIFFSESPPDVVLNQDKIHFKHSFTQSSVYKVFDILLQKIPPSPHSSAIYMLTLRDVTLQEHLQRRLLASAQLAELGTIGGSIAHEINNPLGGIISFLQLIQKDLAPNAPQVKDIEKMEEAAQRSKEIIESLLGFCRKSDLTQTSKINLKNIMEQSLKISTLQAKSSGIEMTLEASDLIHINGNENLLTQALQNLLQNSVDATLERVDSEPDFDPQIRIEITAKENLIQIIITDNGIGINKNNINKIFNPLFTTKNPNTRSGLGLTVSHNIIIDHGGEIEIYSQPNIGTVAKISFKRLDLNNGSQVFDSKI